MSSAGVDRSFFHAPKTRFERKPSHSQMMIFPAALRARPDLTQLPARAPAPIFPRAFLGARVLPPGMHEVPRMTWALSLLPGRSRRRWRRTARPAHTEHPPIHEQAPKRSPSSRRGALADPISPSVRQSTCLLHWWGTQPASQCGAPAPTRRRRFLGARVLPPSLHEVPQRTRPPSRPADAPPAAESAERTPRTPTTTGAT